MTPRWWVMEKKGCGGQVYNLTNTQPTHVSAHALRAVYTISPTRRYAALSTRASDPMLTWSPRITGDLLTLPALDLKRYVQGPSDTCRTGVGLVQDAAPPSHLEVVWRRAFSSIQMRVHVPVLPSR